MKEHHNKKEKKKIAVFASMCIHIWANSSLMLLFLSIRTSQFLLYHFFPSLSTPLSFFLSLSLSVFLLFSPSCCLKLTLSFSHLIQHPKKRTLTPFVWQRVTRSVCVVAAKGSPTTNSVTSFSLACSMHPSEPCSTKSRSATTMGLP